MTSYTFNMMTSNSLKVGSNLMAVPSKISLRTNPGCSYARVDVCLEKKELITPLIQVIFIEASRNSRKICKV